MIVFMAECFREEWRDVRIQAFGSPNLSTIDADRSVFAGVVHFEYSSDCKAIPLVHHITPEHQIDRPVEEIRRCILSSSSGTIPNAPSVMAASNGSRADLCAQPKPAQSSSATSIWSPRLSLASVPGSRTCAAGCTGLTPKVGCSWAPNAQSRSGGAHRGMRGSLDYWVCQSCARLLVLGTIVLPIFSTFGTAAKAIGESATRSALP